MRRAVFALLLISVGLVGCRRKELEAELAKVQAQLQDTQGALQSEQQQNQRLTNENQTFQQRIAELEQSIEQLDAQLAALAREQGVTLQELEELRAERAKREAELNVYRDLFARLKALTDAGTIEIGFRKGRLVVKMSEAILFDSGRAELKAEGQAALTKLVGPLTSVGKRDFLVGGHTDNVPIKTARFKSNWELSTARAVNVVKYMIEQGFPREQLAAAGFADIDPVADNASDQGRAQNRRIEIILMPNLGEIPGMKEMLKKNKS